MAVRTRTATPLYSTLAVADKPAQQRVWIASAISIPNATDVRCIYSVDARPSSDEQTFLFFNYRPICRDGTNCLRYRLYNVQQISLHLTIIRYSSFIFTGKQILRKLVLLQFSFIILQPYISGSKVNYMICLKTARKCSCQIGCVLRVTIVDDVRSNFQLMIIIMAIFQMVTNLHRFILVYVVEIKISLGSVRGILTMKFNSRHFATKLNCI